VEVTWVRKSGGRKTGEWEQLLGDVGFDWVVQGAGEERWYSFRKKLYVLCAS